MELGAASRTLSWEQRVVSGAQSSAKTCPRSVSSSLESVPVLSRGTRLRTAVAGLLRRSVVAGPLLVSPSLFPAFGLSSSVTWNYCSVLWVAVLCFGLPFGWASLSCLFVRNFGRGVLFGQSRTFCEVCKLQCVQKILLTLTKTVVSSVERLRIQDFRPVVVVGHVKRSAWMHRIAAC